MLLSLTAFSQSLFPGLPNVDNMFNYLFALLLSLIISIMIYTFRENAKTQKELTQSVQKLTLEVAITRERERLAEKTNKVFEKSIRILNRRMNRYADFSHKHVAFHKSCKECPPVNEFTDNENDS
jgi:CRISPR/Cas system CSM-associated protein Csm2 small subunit